MVEQIFGAPSLTQVLLAVAVIVFFLGLAWYGLFLLRRLVQRLSRRTKKRLGVAVLSPLVKPVVFIIALLGVYAALFFFEKGVLLRFYGTRAMGVLMLAVAVCAVLTSIDSVIRWYRRDVKEKKKDIGVMGGMLRIFRVLVPVVVLFLAVVAAVNIVGGEAAFITDWLGEHGWRIILIFIVAIVIVIAMGEAIPRVVVRSVSRRPGELDEEVSKRSQTLSKVLTNVAQIFVILIAVFTILSELTIDVTPILASAGVVGIAIGLGAQSLIKDLIAGLFIILENQYRVGDVVKIGNVSGLVEDINLRRTVLRDLDGIVHVVPNGEISVSSNYTKDWSRVNLDISVAYGEDLDRVIPVINRVGNDLAEDPDWAPLILKAPQVLRVNDLGDSGIDIKILGETKPIRQWDVTGELRRRLKKAFDEEGIEIPWPHTKVYFGNVLATGQEPPAPKPPPEG